MPVALADPGNYSIDRNRSLAEEEEEQYFQTVPQDLDASGTSACVISQTYSQLPHTHAEHLICKCSPRVGGNHASIEGKLTTGPQRTENTAHVGAAAITVLVLSACCGERAACRALQVKKQPQGWAPCLRVPRGSRFSNARRNVYPHASEEGKVRRAL